MPDLTTVLVTRPEREAGPWVQALQAEGVRAEAFPLIEIAPLDDVQALQSAWQLVPRCLAVMFVSANAVRFFMATQPAGLDVQACRAWATGPGTQADLLAAGWPAGSTVLIVRGADATGQRAGRDWLAQQIEDVGLQLAQTVAYVRRAPALSDAQQARAQQTLHSSMWWLFSSSEAALHLQQACPGLDLSQAQALATHPRIAERLRLAGWGRVQLVPASLKSQAESIKSLS